MSEWEEGDKEEKGKKDKDEKEEGWKQYGKNKCRESKRIERETEPTRA